MNQYDHLRMADISIVEDNKRQSNDERNYDLTETLRLQVNATRPSLQSKEKRVSQLNTSENEMSGTK